MKVKTTDIKGKDSKEVSLNKKVFDNKVNMPLLCQAVNSYIANGKSRRLASTKTRAEVSGSGAKPWRQKGTGRARVGEKRNPIWVKGGIVFGPRPKKVYKRIPQKMKTSALKSALNAKYRDNQILFLDKLDIKSSKTRDFSNIVKNIKLYKRTVLVDKGFDKEARLSGRNIKNISLIRAADLNAYSALNCKKLVITAAALDLLQKRILGK